MTQAWSQVFLNLLNNLFQTKGNQVRIRNQKGSKFESFQKLIKNCVEWYITSENKHLDVMRTEIMSVIQISCQRVVFQQCFGLFLQNDIFVTVFHAVINIQVISVVKFDSNRNWFRKVQKKSFVRITSRQILSEG